MRPMSSTANFIFFIALVVLTPLALFVYDRTLRRRSAAAGVWISLVITIATVFYVVDLELGTVGVQSMIALIVTRIAIILSGTVFITFVLTAFTSPRMISDQGTTVGMGLPILAIVALGIDVAYLVLTGHPDGIAIRQLAIHDTYYIFLGATVLLQLFLAARGRFLRDAGRRTLDRFSKLSLYGVVLIGAFVHLDVPAAAEGVGLALILILMASILPEVVKVERAAGHQG